MGPRGARREHQARVRPEPILPHPEEARAARAVSKDGREAGHRRAVPRHGHPSRRSRRRAAAAPQDEGMNPTLHRSSPVPSLTHAAPPSHLRRARGIRTRTSSDRPTRFPFAAGTRLHAAGRAGRTLRRAARPSRVRARRDRAGQRPRLRQPRRARCARALSGPPARRRHHGHAHRARGVARVAPARHARAALSPVLVRRQAGLRARRRVRRVRDVPAGDARAQLGHAGVVRLASSARCRRHAARRSRPRCRS